MKKKKFEIVVNDFGKEWSKFNNEALSDNQLRKIFNDYFDIFPKKFLSKDKIGIDLGSGTGRWAKFVAKKVKKLFLLEPSVEAITVSKKKLKFFNNITFINEEIKYLQNKSLKFDFAYSLGVIHHLNYPNKAFKIVNRSLKKNSPFLVYLYHNFEHNNKLYKLIWKLSEILRFYISKSSFKTKSLACDLIALVIYYPLAKLSFILNIFKINIKNIPLNYYKDMPFYVMRNDSLDRFGTTYEKRYSKRDIIKLFKSNGFYNIKISNKQPFWCVVGYKK